MPSVSSHRHDRIVMLEAQQKVLLDALSAIQAVSRSEKAMEGRKTDRLWHAGHGHILGLIEEARREAKALEPVNWNDPDTWPGAANSPAGPQA